MKASSDRPLPDAGLEEELHRFVENRRRIFYLKTDLRAPDDYLRRFAVGQPRQDSFTSEQVAAACRGALGCDPVAIAPLEHQGTFHSLYRLKLGDGQEAIARINRLSHIFRDFQLWVTRWISRTLADRGVPCIEVLAADATRRYVPFDFEILRPARGRCLRELDADEPAMVAQLRRLGEAVAHLHQVQMTGFGWLDPSSLVRNRPEGPVRGLADQWSDYVLLNLEEHVRSCVEEGVLETLQARRVESLFARLEPLFADASSSLLHGDLGSHNVFTDGRRITNLIDWEDSLCGDPAFDVAFWATFHPPRRHRAFLDTYCPMADCSDDFATRFWAYFLRISLSKTVHRRRFGYRDLPGRRPANQRIRDALSGLEAAFAGRGEAA